MDVMAEVTLISKPVPRAFRSVDDVLISGPPSDHARRVSDSVVCVILAHDSVNNPTINSRPTCSIFEVKGQGGVGNESASASEGTPDALWFVNG